MLAGLCYVCGYGIVCPSILCVRVCLYSLSAGLTYLWLYACSTRITLHNVKKCLLSRIAKKSQAVADPGFPSGGGANHPGRAGRQDTILPKFP